MRGEVDTGRKMERGLEKWKGGVRRLERFIGSV